MTDKEIIHRLRGQLENCVNHLDNANRHGYRNKFDGCIESANRALYETANIKDVEEKESFSYQELLNSWQSRIDESANSESPYVRGIASGMGICWSELLSHFEKVGDV